MRRTLLMRNLVAVSAMAFQAAYDVVRKRSGYGEENRSGSGHCLDRVELGVGECQPREESAHTGDENHYDKGYG